MSDLFFGSYSNDDGELRLILKVGEQNTLLADPFASELLPILVNHQSATRE